MNMRTVSHESWIYQSVEYALNLLQYLSGDNEWKFSSYTCHISESNCLVIIHMHLGISKLRNNVIKMFCSVVILRIFYECWEGKIWYNILCNNTWDIYDAINTTKWLNIARVLYASCTVVSRQPPTPNIGAMALEWLQGRLRLIFQISCQYQNTQLDV